MYIFAYSIDGYAIMYIINVSRIISYLLDDAHWFRNGKCYLKIGLRKD